MSALLRCDGCGRVQDGRRYDNYSWHAVESNEDSDHGDFCSWGCLARWATNLALTREGVEALNGPADNDSAAAHPEVH